MLYNQEIVKLILSLPADRNFPIEYPDALFEEHPLPQMKELVSTILSIIKCEQRTNEVFMMLLVMLFYIPPPKDKTHKNILRTATSEWITKRWEAQQNLNLKNPPEENENNILFKYMPTYRLQEALLVWGAFKSGKANLTKESQALHVIGRLYTSMGFLPFPTPSQLKIKGYASKNKTDQQNRYTNALNEYYRKNLIKWIGRIPYKVLPLTDEQKKILS